MFDFEKIGRQLAEALHQTKAAKRRELLISMKAVYDAMMVRDRSTARTTMNKFYAQAKELGWDGSGAALPRPFNHPHLEKLYWQAHKELFNVGQPRRFRPKPPPDSWVGRH